MWRRDRARRVARATGAIVATVVAMLIPKCPLCVAAALSAVGVGAALAPVARPLAIALAVAAMVGLARSEWRRRRHRGCADACRRRALRGGRTHAQAAHGPRDRVDGCAPDA